MPASRPVHVIDTGEPVPHVISNTGKHPDWREQGITLGIVVRQTFSAESPAR
jgi:hypothetical protein